MYVSPSINRCWNFFFFQIPDECILFHIFFFLFRDYVTERPCGTLRRASIFSICSFDNFSKYKILQITLSVHLHESSRRLKAGEIGSYQILECKHRQSEHTTKNNFLFLNLPPLKRTDRKRNSKTFCDFSVEPSLPVSIKLLCVASRYIHT